MVLQRVLIIVLKYYQNYNITTDNYKYNY